MRLYIAKATPNSVRAEANLLAALDPQNVNLQLIDQEVIDVFVHPKQAINDGIFVTPTLVTLSRGKRNIIVGDLSNAEQLHALFIELGILTNGLVQRVE